MRRLTLTTLLIALHCAALPAAGAETPWRATPDGLYSPAGDRVAKAVDRAFRASEFSRSERRALLFASLATAADIYTTRRGLAGGCREANPIYGSNPSTAKLVGVGVIQMGLIAWVMQRPGEDHSRGATGAGALRLIAAIWNSQQPCFNNPRTSP